jgi:hypothetical protein
LSDGGGRFDLVDISAESARRWHRAVSQKLNPTNHMRATDVGAFILPSVARISPHPPHPIRTCDDQLKTAMKHDLDHCDRASLAWCTNRLPDCGTRADRSITGRTFDGWSGRTAGDGPSSEELLAERTTNSGERANVSAAATATIFPLACLPPIIGASIAT